MAEVLFEHFHEKLRGRLAFARYEEGDGRAVELLHFEPDGGYWAPYARLSVNVAGTVLGPDEFVAKTYSENEGLVEQFVPAYFSKTGRTAQCGYAGPQPILRLTDRAKAEFERPTEPAG